MTNLARHELIEKITAEILVCPNCGNNLSFKDKFLLCEHCPEEYPIIDGIIVFTKGASKEQETERIFRDKLGYDSFLTGENDIFQEVAKHHSVPVMKRLARSFISNFSSSEYIADIGSGFAWHWKDNNPNNCTILGIDFSITNLKVARRLLTPKDRVILICADAANLPIKSAMVSGVWSVQTFQHFPEPVFEKAKAELDRIMKPEFIIEMINLNPASLLRLASAIFRSSRNSPSNNVLEPKRNSAQKLQELWKDLRNDILMDFSYSELFFHPPYLKPLHYPLFLENIAAIFPGIAKQIARQIHLKIVSK